MEKIIIRESNASRVQSATSFKPKTIAHSVRDSYIEPITSITVEGQSFQIHQHKN